MSEADQALTRAKKLYDRLLARRQFVADMDDAYRGIHRLCFATEEWADYNAARYANFSDNWCSVVANSPNERLGVNGFRLDKDPQESPEERQLHDDWSRNDMELQSSQGFLHTLISSRSGVLVWGDPKTNEPVATWEHAGEVIFDYGPENARQPVAILKSWHHEDSEYMNLYEAKWVWKWERPYRQTSQPLQRIAGNPTAEEFFQDTPYGLLVPGSADDGTGWVPRQASGDDTWPIPNPLHEVPGVEFMNRPMLGGDPISEIQGTLAMQHAINLLWAYLFNAADYASMPARVVLGQSPPKMPILDDTGKQIGEQEIDVKRVANARILWLTGENTKIGQWDAAQLDKFTAIIESAVAHIAAQTRTPPHYLILGKGMVNVNAEGMKAAETGLVMKVNEEQVSFTPAVRQVFRLMALARGNEKVAERCRVGAVQWKDAENRSIAQQVDALLKLQTIGFPFAWLAEQYGLDATEISRVMDMREKQLASDPLMQLGAASQAVGQSMPLSEPGNSNPAEG